MRGYIAVAGLLCALAGFSGGIYLGARMGYEKGVAESEAAWKLATERGELICGHPSVIAAAVRQQVAELAHRQEVTAHARMNDENTGDHGVWGWAPRYNQQGEIVAYLRYDTGVPFGPKWKPTTTTGGRPNEVIRSHTLRPMRRTSHGSQ